MLLEIDLDIQNEVKMFHQLVNLYIFYHPNQKDIY